MIRIRSLAILCFASTLSSTATALEAVTEEIPIELGYLAACPKAKYDDNATKVDWKWVSYDGKNWPCEFEWPAKWIREWQEAQKKARKE